jgi:hypothetical protein
MSGVLNDTITEVLLLNARKKSLKIPNGLLEVVNRRTDKKGQRKQDKRTNNDLQSTTQKTKD